MNSNFSDIVDQVHHLDTQSKTELLDLLRAWLIEERREEIARNARESHEAYQRGEAKQGTAADLMADLYGED